MALSGTFTDDTRPLSLLSIATQADTVNTNYRGVIVQTGWGFIAGNSTGSNTKAITFPLAFTTIVNVVVGNLGYISGSDPTSITSFNAGESGDIVHRTGYSISTTGFTAQVQSENGRNLAASTIRYGFSWIAIGT